MDNKPKCHITSIGGQAVIEGVMMRGPKEIATAVRTPDGEIVVDKKPVSSITQKLKFLKLPILRGVVSFIESLIIGTKSLMYSAEFFDIEEEEDKKKKETMSEEERQKLEKKESKMKNVAIYSSVVFALIFGVALFMLLPGFLIDLIRKLIPTDFAGANIVATLVEGIVRISIFLIYVALVSQMKDIRRVFEYHGAEHKTIFCYESGEELTVENARKFSRLHPRCGTSFLLIVMVVSIILFSFITWENMWMRLGIRLLLLPVVAGISYEIIKLAGRSKSKIMRVVSLPGMWLQKITTREPDDSQLEVAIASLKAVLTDNREDDKW